MKNTIRIISLLLTALMLLGSMTVLSAITVYAADDTDSGSGSGNVKQNLEEKINSYKTTVYKTPDEKVATMGAPRLTCGDYEFYIDEFSGEVALKNVVTNEYLFSNPYDIGASKANEANGQTKEELLSQIIVNFTSNGNPNEFYSFREAAARNQIKVKNIKNGIRVEYTIGREQSKLLVPRVIEESEYQKMIAIMKSNVSADPKQEREDLFRIDKLDSYYTLYDVSTMKSEAQKNSIYKKYPVTKTKGMVIRVFDPTASDVELTTCEDIIKTFHPDYTYEMLDEHHAQTEYEGEDLNPPLFKMALEYTLDENGLSVRLPANGIRFNESLYQLNSIEILPYMGAGNNAYNGYNVFPDGSGATFDYQDLKIDIPKNVNGKIYGKDYAYHSITGQYQKSISYPVFGAVEETTYYTYTYTVSTLNDTQLTVNGDIVDKYYNDDYTVNDFKSRIDKLPIEGGRTLGAIIGVETAEPKITVDKRGFMAIIEEGEALTEISTNHPGTTSEYNSLQICVTPRPTDTYTVSGSLSVNSANNEYTVVCDRKYVGSYKIRYTLLSDYNDNLAPGEEKYNCYDTSWFGMAVAYRDYLMSENVGILSPLTSEEITENNIPLYIESFGALETLQKFLSVPIKTMTALTTFEDIQTMYNDLSAGGVKNVNFKLKGYANGGLESTVPYKFDIENAVGGEKGFQELLNYAADVNADEDANLGIFPDFDFAYVKYTSMFDGINERKHVAKTIDDRYASRREYSATQGMVNYYELAISPAYYNRFYEKIKETYLESYQNVYGISVSTLGSALNSDFDEDEPYNREDSKDHTELAFKHFDANYNQVMTDVGNSYSWKYVDHILGVSLDSSRYNISADSIPFIGVVLHGSIQFAGSPMNMEGNIEYAILKALENGASPYFILSYRNTQNLKENESFSKYYSVRYDIWKDDLIETYNVLNNALSDVQDKFIIGHTKVEGATRIPDIDEIEADLRQMLKDYAELQDNADQIQLDQSRFEVSIARDMCRALLDEAVQTNEIVLTLYDALITGNTTISGVITYSQVLSRYNNYKNAITTYEANKDNVQYKDSYDKYKAVEEYAAFKDSENEEEQALYQLYLEGKDLYKKEHDLYVKYEKALANKYDTLYNYLIPYTKLFQNQEVLVVNGESIYAKDMMSLIEDMYEKLEKAVEYIEIIAAFEGATITYEEGREGDIYAIQNVDSLPRFTKKAIEQATTAYNNVQSERFIESTQSIQHDTSTKTQNFASYDENGNIPDVNVKESYYVLFDDGVKFDANGNDISEKDIAFTGTSISNYRYFEILDVTNSDKTFRSQGDDGYVKGRYYHRLTINGQEVVVQTINYEGGKVVLVPIGEEQMTDVVYRNLRINGEWFYYSKDADGNIVDYYLPTEDGNYTKIEAVEYDGNAVSPVGTVIKVLKNEQGDLITDAAGQPLYISGTDHNDFRTYGLSISAQEMCEDFEVKVDAIIKDTAALGEITEEEFLEMLGGDEEEEVEDEVDDNQTVITSDKYATKGIIAVTYGTLEGVAYKTMLLNYNNYAVNVTYEGVHYTIPAYGFVTIMN